MAIRRFWPAVLLFGSVLAATPAARAVTLGEALATERLLATVDAMAPDQRPAFIQQHRAELNQALMTRQILMAIGRTMNVASWASERAYHTALVCSPDMLKESDDDEREETGPPASADVPDLPAMAAAFKEAMKTRLHLPDTPATEARLNQIEVTHVIVNQMIERNKCAHD
jgi:hypothetical protein